MMHRRISTAVAVAAVVSTFGIGSVFASPYAAQLTQSNGNLNFVLSEDADHVMIVRNGVTTDLGALTAGNQTVALNGATDYQVIATKNSGTGYQFVDNSDRGAVTGSGIQGPQGVELQIGDAAANRAQQFELPRDVIINKNPLTPELFGRAYVLQPRTASTASGRPTTEGIYILNADRTQNALNPGDTALTGGVTFDGTASNIVDLFKGQLDADGNLYVSDWSDPATPGVRTWDPNISTGGNVLTGTAAAVSPPVITPTATQNHGSVSGLVVTGSAANGTLVIRTVDEDLGVATAADTSAGNNAIYTYNLGSQRLNNPAIPTVSVAQPLFTASVDNDLEQGPGGRLYITQYRSDGLESGLFVLNNAADKVQYSSIADARLLNIDGNTSTAANATGIQDVYRLVRGIDVSPDGKWLAAQSDSGGRAYVTPLIDGIPDLANMRILLLGTTSGSNVEFDAANNLWSSNRGTEKVQEWSPGGPSYTVYSSAGTFKAINGKDFEGSGSYSDSSKWAFGQVAGFGTEPATEDRALIGSLSSGAQTLTIDTPVVLSNLTFAGGNYTVNGTANIRFGSDSQFESFLEGRVIAETGTQVINAPITVTKNFGVAAYAGASLTLKTVNYESSPQLVNGVPTSVNGTFTMQKFGGGTVNMPVFSQGLLVIRDGTLKFNSPTSAGAAKITRLSMSGVTPASQKTSTATPPVTTFTTTSGTPVGKLDLGATGLVIDYAPLTGDAVSPITDVNYLLAQGRTAGVGIVTSASATDARLTVAAAEASALPTTLNAGTFMGQSIDSTSILIRTTLKGDANLDGSVSFADLVTLAQNYNGTDKTFITGDFNYDGLTNFADLVSLAQAYNQSYNGAGSIVQFASAASFDADWALAQSLVPEPTSLSLLGLGGLAMIRRRR